MSHNCCISRLSIFVFTLEISSGRYSFAVFAYILFCDSLNAKPDDDVDDDAKRWEDLSNLLNFKTFPQSLHTLFQLSIIGNWSSVMSAAAESKAELAYFFFFFYRIFIAVVAMPILLSFVIQTYVSQQKKLKLIGKVKNVKINC